MFDPRWEDGCPHCSAGADEGAKGKGIAFTESPYAAQREWKTFAATDGSLTEQVITHVGAGIESGHFFLHVITHG